MDLSDSVLALVREVVINFKWWVPDCAFLL